MALTVKVVTLWKKPHAQLMSNENQLREGNSAKPIKPAFLQHGCKPVKIAIKILKDMETVKAGRATSIVDHVLKWNQWIPSMQRKYARIATKRSKYITSMCWLLTKRNKRWNEKINQIPNKSTTLTGWALRWLYWSILRGTTGIKWAHWWQHIVSKRQLENLWIIWATTALDRDKDN